MMFLRLVPLLAFAACGVLAGDAIGAPATAVLETTSGAGAADCPGAEALAASVNDGLGRRALSASGSGAADADAVVPLRVVVAFERAGSGYAATVNIGGGRGGTRRLTDGGAGCGTLANAVGVLLVVLLDSDAETLTGGVAPRSSTHAAASSPSPDTVTRLTVGAGGGVAEGLLGGWSPTVGLGGTLAYRRWSARLGGVWLPGKSNPYGDGRVEVGLAFTRLALCMSVRDGGASTFTLAFCGQQQIGWMRGRGVAYDAGNRSTDNLWLATGASIVASGRWERSFGWEIEAGAARVLRQQRFVVGNLGTAFETDPWAFMTTLTFTTRLW